MGSLDDGSGIKPDGDDGLVWFHTMGKHPVFFLSWRVLQFACRRVALQDVYVNRTWGPDRPI